MKEKFESHFGHQAVYIASAPGRINLIGDHTDYNGGYVLPAAFDRHMHFALSPRGDGMIQIVATDIDDSIEVCLNHLSKTDKSWVNFFIGILLQLKKEGISLCGFNLMFGGNIPIGGGLSSSSAIECGFLKLLNEWLALDLNHDQIIQISKKSNHEFLGLQGGIMDQYAVLNGKADHAMLLDCATNTAKYIPINTIGHSFVLIDSKVSHELVDSAYNDRVAECQEGLKIIQKKLPHITSVSQMDQETLLPFKKNMSNVAYKRIKFVIEENERVLAFCKAMRLNQFTALGEILHSSHSGLRDQYEVSCKEIDLLVGLALKSDHVLGARMMGGGFGGCTLNLIKTSQKVAISEKIARSYHALTGISPDIYPVEIVDGVQITKVG